MKFLWRNSSLLLISLLAISLRVFRPGLFPVNPDELDLLFWSLNMGRRGIWLWLSNNRIGWSAPWFPITHHSPLNNYLPVIPYLFSPDPSHVRLFVGLLCALGIIIIALMVRRYFGEFAGNATGLLFAVNATAVFYNRWVFHISLAWIFIAIWGATGLIGYYEGRRWAKVTHWIALAVALQLHPTNALLIVPTLVLVAAAWLHNPADRRYLMRYTLVGWGLAALTLIPWAIGIIFKDLSAQIGIMAHPRPEAFIETAPAVFSFTRMMNTYSAVVGGVSRFSVERMSDTAAWPPMWTNIILLTQVWFSFLGAIGFVFYGLRGRWRSLPATFFALIAIFPLFTIFLVTSTDLREWYICLVAFGAFPIQGVLLAKLAGSQRWRRTIAIGVLIAVTLVHLWLNLAYFYWLDTDGWQSNMDAPMDVYRSMIAEQAGTQREIVLDIDGGRDWATPTDQTYFWRVIGEGYPMRIFNRSNGQGISFSTQQESLLIGFADRQPVISDAEAFIFSTSDNKPVFYRADVSADSIPQPNFAPVETSLFSNGVRIIGIFAQDMPQPSTIWQVLLIWQIDEMKDTAEYQFSLRLVNEQDELFGQNDFPSLTKDLWRVGDVVINPAAIAVGEKFSGSVRVQILMYTWPEIRNADVIADNGQIAGPWLYIE